MKYIFLSDPEEEAIVEFIKQHEELHKTHHKFKDKQKNEGLWERVAAFRNLSCQHFQEVVQDSMYQIWQAHSDEVRTSC